MRFTTKADYWSGGDVKSCTIVVENKGGTIFVDGREAKMSFNHIQLRFETTIGRCRFTYIVFDDRHLPPKPIAQMFKELGGVEAKKRASR